jgi:hypothetical protein
LPCGPFGKIAPDADSLKVPVWTRHADYLAGYIDNAKLEKE